MIKIVKVGETAFTIIKVILPSFHRGLFVPCCLLN
nr:MAG TPA: hypothetical protein [Caudoviricetes sp.]